MSVSRSLVLNHGSIETSILIPTENYLFYQQLKYGFAKSLPDVTEGFASDEEPSSRAELLMKFLGYVATSNIDQAEKSDAISLIFQEFEAKFLQGDDIHTFAGTLLKSETDPTTLIKIKENLIKNYFLGQITLNQNFGLQSSASSLFSSSNSKVSSALLQAGKDRQALIHAIFGGQGNTDDYFEELRDIYNVYHGLIAEFIENVQERIQSLIRVTAGANRVYTQGFNLTNWLENPEETPDTDYLLSIPVSCPLICVIQLCHYVITCKALGIEPGSMRDCLAGATGHSQGLVTAVVVAASDSWKTFDKTSLQAVELLFFIGVRCLQAYPSTSLPPTVLEDSAANSEGKPTPMLSIRDLSTEQVQKYVDETNKHLPKEKHIEISLINGARNLVVTGPPQSLYGLNLTLRKAKAPSGLDQARIPFSERKLKFSNRFLPISSPFHSHLLAPATEKIVADLQNADSEFKQSDLKIPVYDTFDGTDLREYQGSIVGRLVECITQLPVNWETATTFQSTHLLDFGPGGASGLGLLTHRNKEGTGVRVIIAGVLETEPEDFEYGYKQEIFDRDVKSVKYSSNWLNEFQPKLVQTKAGEVYVDTKFSRLLGRAPLMVPGMTPTTVSPDFVAATLNAGYHIEIAGGGYFSPGMMQGALQKVADQTKPGTGIGINLIYVNPRMLQWGIPMIKELRDKGFPIQSLTIGAGVPSLEVASEYIETLGLTHLGLKPGSVDSISQCITIAKAHPTFPIVIQWTGGRGGGHHSFEDYHQAILQMYSKIRRCPNIILIAGSGFGAAEDTYPYLTGSWSKAFNYPEMPFDGVLFGSRVMVAKEAETSLNAKKAIAACPGVPDSEWEQTYKRPTGGILTVRSEMGEPIHKIATRGVKFWKEMDDTIFNLPKNKMLEALSKKKEYIIGKLNADFQKPWFGKNENGPCDLQEMTYQEVVERLVELMYIKKSERWIDVSLRNMTGTFLRRLEERFINKSGTLAIIQNFAQLDKPEAALKSVFDAYPDAREQLINAQDCDFFLSCCQNPIQKPVPFVPVLDEKFEVYFKKDSLWQSEDLEAVVDEDVERTCILHGPVAARYTNKVDEPIKEILDNIHNGHIESLLKDVYGGDKAKIPVVEYFGGSQVQPLASLPGVTVQESSEKIVYTVKSKVQDEALWFSLLGGSALSWRRAFLTSQRLVQGQSYVSNPAHDVLKPYRGNVVEVAYPGEPSKTTVTAFEKVQGVLRPTVSIKLNSKSLIQMDLIEHRNADSKQVSLELLYQYQPLDGFAPILEITEGRNNRIKEFYWKLWFGLEEPVKLDFNIKETIDGGETEITQQAISEFTHAIGNTCEDFVPRVGRETLVPMDFGIVVGWKAVIKALFAESVDGDLLKLVHLSNGYRMLTGAAPLKRGDKVHGVAEVQSVTNSETGKTVSVLGTILRDGKPVMEINSQFFYRGTYSDFDKTFKKVTETPYQVILKAPKDVAVLRSKEWLHLHEDVDLLGQTLTFRCQSEVTFRNHAVFSAVKTTGQVLLELPSKEIKQIGDVVYNSGEAHGNPVIDYLQRNGSTIEQPILFENAIPISAGAELTSKAPVTNEPYAVVSGDYNPIHVSRVFANYAKLPGTITHGMYSSGAVRALVEQFAANNVSSRVRAFDCSFVGMVLPNDLLETKLEHVGMINGRKIIKITTLKVETEEPVLIGEAEIDQPASTFVFTGQGSQEQGMGMDMYDSSEVARSVWDKADQHFINNYGFSIVDIVRNNPKELTVHFGGAKGRAIRENYKSMMFETIGDNGELKSEKIFREIDDETTSYTFVSPTGLLSATQFTQPALTLMEKASFEDMKSKGLIPAEAMFAGHSLGEYSALASLGDVMPIESLVDVVFYRGMTMQVAVPRDEAGRSNYGMCAVNPSRISATFNDAALRFVVDHIAKQTGWLLEIVNYNVENTQYVTAGDLRALDTLTNVLNVFKLQKIDIVKLQEMMPLEKVAEHLSEIVDEVSKKSVAKPQPIDLERGFACIPLKGISVPFHSSYLRSGVKPFQRFLVKKIPKSAVKPANLIGKYIPNLTAEPFAITKEYFETVYELTKSEKIKAILDNWEHYESS